MMGTTNVIRFAWRTVNVGRTDERWAGASYLRLWIDRSGSQCGQQCNCQRTNSVVRLLARPAILTTDCLDILVANSHQTRNKTYMVESGWLSNVFFTIRSAYACASMWNLKTISWLTDHSLRFIEHERKSIALHCSDFMPAHLVFCHRDHVLRLIKCVARLFDSDYPKLTSTHSKAHYCKQRLRCIGFIIRDT